MACLRLILVCVLLLLPGQAMSQEGATPQPLSPIPPAPIQPLSPIPPAPIQRLSPIPPAPVRKLTVVPVKPSLPPALAQQKSSQNTADIATRVSRRISNLEEELAIRCKLHGQDLYPVKSDGLVAIAARLAEYEGLLRTREFLDSPPATSPRSKLDSPCHDLINAARARAGVESTRQKVESVAFSTISVNAQTTVDRTEIIEEFFPWPPRWPTSRWLAAPDLFSDRNRFSTLANVNDFLREKLQQAGYGDYGYFKIKDRGFAIVTRLERINEKGEPDLAKRFDPSLKPTSSFNLAEYVYRLFLGATGRYRVFVFLFTPELIESQQPGRQIEYALAREWNQHGTDALPPNIGALRVTAEHKLTVLVYEFIYREREKAPPYVLSSGGINPIQHLAATKITLRP
jgi:hypothetical protein